MVARGGSGDASEPMLTHRRPGDLAPTFVQFPLGKLRVQVRHVGTKRGAAVGFGALLLLFASVALMSRTAGRTLPDRQDVTGPASHSEATLLLAKTSGLSNPDEAKVLLEALQDGALDYGTVSSALEEDLARKEAKIIAEAEKEASRKAAEEKAAAEKAAAEKAAAAKAAAEKAAADKAAAEKAAADKAAAEKAAAKKAAEDMAAAERASQKMHKSVPRSLVDVFHENDDDYYDEDDWLEDEFEDEIDDGDSLAFPRREQKRSALSDNQGEGRAPAMKRKDGAPSTNSWRNKVDRKRRSRLSDEPAEEDEEDWLGDEIDDGDSLALSREEYFGNKQRGKSSPLRTYQRPSHSPPTHPKATKGARRQAPDGGAGRQRGGVRGEGGGRRGVPPRLP